MKNSVEAGMAFAPSHEPFPTRKPMTETELNARIEELALQQSESHSIPIRRKTGRRYRRMMATHKTTELRKIVTQSYAPHAGYVQWEEIDGVWVPAGKYIKYPKNSNTQKWIKRYTGKKMRRSHDIPHKGNHYRRLFDYWGTMY